jgi:hypothetical protein
MHRVSTAAVRQRIRLHVEAFDFRDRQILALRLMDLKHDSDPFTPALSRWKWERTPSAARTMPTSEEHPRAFLELRLVV